MINDSIYNKNPYSFDKIKKNNLFNKNFHELTLFHYSNCLEYKKILDAIGYDPKSIQNYSKTPFLPVRLFKIFDFYSIPKKDIVRTMTSSGTSGQQVSKIFLDKKTSFNQTKVLTKIVSSFIGTKRTPMIIIDSPSVIKDRKMFSARGAGILGFSIFGSKKLYALDENMELRLDELKKFFIENKNNKIFIFGFTFMIFKYFLIKLKELKMKIDLSGSVLIHGGGWKKLESESISADEFKKLIYDFTKITSIHDYYGMVEQTGSIFMECENGNLHASVFSDIFIRRFNDFSIADVGEKGIIQTLSLLPGSYPGHSLLTEDEGVFMGEDDCGCGRLGKYFKIYGRVKNAEIRGCSDTYEG